MFFAKSLDTELERLDTLLSRQESRIRQAFAEFVRDAKSEAVVKEATDLLSRGDIEGALRIVDGYIARFGTVLPSVFQQAAAVELPAIAAQIAPLLPTIAVSFDPTDLRAAAVMREATLELVTNFTSAQRGATRQALTTAFETGQGTQGMARAFRDSIGLTAGQEQAVRNYRALLEGGSRDALDRALRDRRFDRSVARAADGGAPLTPAQIDTMVERYRGRYLIYRSEVIARTEAVRAVSVARELALRQNLDAAGIGADAVTQTWRAVDDQRTRTTHRAMNGQQQPLGQAFLSPSGALLRYPGDPDAPVEEVVECRCHKTYAIDVGALKIAA